LADAGAFVSCRTGDAEQGPDFVRSDTVGKAIPGRHVAFYHACCEVLDVSLVGLRASPTMGGFHVISSPVGDANPQLQIERQIPDSRLSQRFRADANGAFGPAEAGHHRDALATEDLGPRRLELKACPTADIKNLQFNLKSEI